MPNLRSRVDSVQCLRGLAAFVVMFQHFTLAAAYPITVVDLGKVGVASFFVISGFVLPYSLSCAGYTSASYPTFLKKRLIRLEPPYLASIVLIICFNFLTPLAPGSQAGSYHFSPVQLLLPFGYIIPFSHYQWFTESFWTLAIRVTKPPGSWMLPISTDWVSAGKPWRQTMRLGAAYAGCPSMP